LAQDAFTHRADLLGDPLAPDVADRTHDLEAGEISRPKHRVGNETSRGGSHAAAHRRRANPIPEVGEAIRLVDLIDATSTEVTSVIVANGELVRKALPRQFLLARNPAASLIERVVWLTPGQPLADFRD